MNNNNQIKTVLVADIELEMIPDINSYDYNETKVFLDTDENRSYLDDLNLHNVNNQLVDNANDEISSDESFGLYWECDQVNVRKKQVAVDDLTSEQMATFLASNPQLSLKRVDGEQVSFKTKDTYYLEQTESKIDNDQNIYKESALTSLDAFVDDKQVVNS